MGKDLGEPSDLPSVIREDMLMLAPVNPSRLFATWHISYSTQNRLRDFIGEEAFDTCRLILSLKRLDSNAESQAVDVSGPTTSCYIYLENQSSRRSELYPFEAVHMYGDLCYIANGSSYSITRSGLITLPRPYMSPRWDEKFPPCTEMYERIFRRLDPQSTIDRETMTLVQLGELLDTQLGLVTNY
ncbi:DUF4912 domain-containing protein [bacterium]|nr:DUF4912 domain-containing protein [bacterium]